MKKDESKAGRLSHLPPLPAWGWLLLLVVNLDDVARRGWRSGLITVGFGMQMVVYDSLRRGDTMAWPWYKKIGSILFSCLGLVVMIYGFFWF